MVSISAAYIPSELVAQETRTRQPVGTPPTTAKGRQPATPVGAQQQRTAAESIIEAEYVDLYQPLRRPPDNSQHWRTLLVEPDEEKTGVMPRPSDSDPRIEKMIRRYGEHAKDLPRPGSHFNLIV